MGAIKFRVVVVVVAVGVIVVVLVVVVSGSQQGLSTVTTYAGGALP